MKRNPWRVTSVFTLSSLAAMASGINNPVIDFTVAAANDPGVESNWMIESGNLVRTGSGPVGIYQVHHFEDTYVGLHQFLTQDMRLLATADVDYRYQVQWGDFTGDDLFHEQATRITFTAGPTQAARITFRVNYPTDELYPDLTNQPTVDDVSLMFAHLTDLNGNGAFMRGLLPIAQPGGMFLSSVNNRYESLGDSQVMGVPLGSLELSMDRIPRDRPVVIHCKSGARSARAVGQLRAKGYTNVKSLSGGILAW
ncbi:MAG: rhodanese-like domain-containing protein, partial [Planctomycetota bacterium]|nr:rhodanese-like domain-containing protein [Planctomycetota bacterium]